MQKLVVAAFMASAAVPAAAAATTAFTVELPIRHCTAAAGCGAPVATRVALDVASKHTSPAGEELVSVSGNALTLTYGGGEVGGPRVYLIEPEGTNANHLFMLKGQEFAFNVELSTMPCGFNAALYFVGMDANEGGAEQGTNYCDAQAVAGTFCSEMDLWEANTEAQQYTTHACIDACGSFAPNATECKRSGSAPAACDQSGCGLNPFRYVCACVRAGGRVVGVSECVRGCTNLYA
jgi:hypothetical protein